MQVSNEKFKRLQDHQNTNQKYANAVLVPFDPLSTIDAANKAAAQAVEVEKKQKEIQRKNVVEFLNSFIGRMVHDVSEQITNKKYRVTPKTIGVGGAVHFQTSYIGVDFGLKPESILMVAAKLATKLAAYSGWKNVVVCVKEYSKVDTVATYSVEVRVEENPSTLHPAVEWECGKERTIKSIATIGDYEKFTLEELHRNL